MRAQASDLGFYRVSRDSSASSRALRSLHGLQAGTRLVRVSSPPCAVAMTWSTVVAGDGQYAQVGLPASMSRRLRFHSVVLVRRACVRLRPWSHRVLWVSQLRVPPGTSSMQGVPSGSRCEQYLGARVISTSALLLCRTSCCVRLCARLCVVWCVVCVR